MSTSTLPRLPLKSTLINPTLVVKQNHDLLLPYLYAIAQDSSPGGQKAIFTGDRKSLIPFIASSGNICLISLE